MKPVVKYGVYYDILLRVPIYVTKCRFLKETAKTQITRFARLLLGAQRVCFVILVPCAFHALRRHVHEARMRAVFRM